MTDTCDNTTREQLKYQLDYCCRYNSVYFLERIINSNFDFSKELKTLFLIKCLDGNLNIVKYLLSHRDFDDSVLNEGFQYACQSFHLDISNFLLSTGKINLDENIGDIFINSFDNNKLEMLNWIMSVGKIRFYHLVESRLWRGTNRLKIMKIICGLNRIS